MSFKELLDQILTEGFTYKQADQWMKNYCYVICRKEIMKILFSSEMRRHEPFNTLNMVELELLAPLVLNQQSEFGLIAPANVTANFVPALLRVLRFNTALMDLAFFNYQLEPSSMSALRDAMLINTGLTSLKLISVSVDPSHLAHFVAGLKYNNKLSTLDLGFNLINDQVARYLSETLSVNTALEELFLDFTRLTPQQLEVLTQGLRLNVGLSKLSLRGNHPLGHEGALCLAEMIRSESKLKRLTMSNCFFSPVDWSAIADALEQQNTSLIHIDHCFENYTHVTLMTRYIETCERINRLLARNGQLQSKFSDMAHNLSNPAKSISAINAFALAFLSLPATAQVFFVGSVDMDWVKLAKHLPIELMSELKGLQSVSGRTTLTFRPTLRTALIQWRASRPQLPEAEAPAARPQLSVAEASSSIPGCTIT